MSTRQPSRWLRSPPKGAPLGSWHISLINIWAERISSSTASAQLRRRNGTAVPNAGTALSTERSCRTAIGCYSGIQEIRPSTEIPHYSRPFFRQSALKRNSKSNKKKPTAAAIFVLFAVFLQACECSSAGVRGHDTSDGATKVTAVKLICPSLSSDG